MEAHPFASPTGLSPSSTFLRCRCASVQRHINVPTFKYGHNLAKESLWMDGELYQDCLGKGPKVRALQSFTGGGGEEEAAAAAAAYARKRKKRRILMGLYTEEADLEKKQVQIHSRNTCQKQETGWLHSVVASLKACANQKELEKGIQIHADIVRMGLLEGNPFLGSALVSMYAKCGSLARAQQVFNKLPVRNIVSWGALSAGYMQHGQNDEALKCYEQMQMEGHSPDSFMFVCVLKACGSIGAVEKGHAVCNEIIKKGFLEKDILVGTALVGMYIKCNSLAKAHEVFDKLPVRDVVAWNALIAGYAQGGQGAQALKYFKQMQFEGLSPNAVTYACVLKACGSIGAANKGKAIHLELVQGGLLKKSVLVGTALIDMYAKCGLLANAQEVFDELPIRNVASWTALMAGYALLGKAEYVFNSFDMMLKEGVKPDLITFTTILKACSHTGLLDKGQRYFETMKIGHGIKPTLEHYTCMVNLFARAGHLEKAIAMINEMPFSADLRVWLTVLIACKKWRNINFGRLAFEHAVQLAERDAGAYVLMSDIYAEAGRQGDADKVEALRVQKQAWKKPGQCAWTDLFGNVHVFSAENKKHPQSEIIHAKLEYLANKMLRYGFSQGLQWVSWNITDDAKTDVSCMHSEMLAIVCALINTPNGTPIHVIKDTEICSYCHFDMSLISILEKRKIFVKDANCFHVFENGKCDCEAFS